jgi:hypothetical protein
VKNQKQEADLTRVIEFIAKTGVFKKKIIDYAKPKAFLLEALKNAELETFSKESFIYDYGKKAVQTNFLRRSL